MAKATSIQDGRGHVDRHTLRLHFVSQGTDAREFEAALESLREAGDIRKDGHWLILP